MRTRMGGGKVKRRKPQQRVDVVRAWAKDCPPQLDPAFDAGWVNLDVLLYHGKGELRQDTAVHDGTATVELRWLPTPKVRFTFDVAHAYDLGDAELLVDDKPKPIPVLITSLELQSDSPGTLSGHVPPIGFGERDAALSHVLFHLPNFHMFVGSPVQHESIVGAPSISMARATIRVPPWSVLLDRVFGCDHEVSDLLADEGGYAITHVGRIEREDTATFTRRDVLTLLEPLGHFLSFCRGFSTHPLLICGVDATSRIWEDWRVPRLERHHRTLSWFHIDSSEGLEYGFPGFQGLWDNPTWKRTLQETVKWYTVANTGQGGLEGSIILAFAALELLAWTTLVDDRRTLSSTGFDSLRSSDKLRLLLTTYELPLSIPSALTGLTRTAGRRKWMDAPEALSTLRNSFVHPRKPKKSRDDDAGQPPANQRLPWAPETVYDAWNLCLHWIELVVLRLSGYGKRYFDRTDNSIGLVPWAVRGGRDE